MTSQGNTPLHPVRPQCTRPNAHHSTRLGSVRPAGPSWLLSLGRRGLGKLDGQQNRGCHPTSRHPSSNGHTAHKDMHRPSQAKLGNKQHPSQR